MLSMALFPSPIGIDLCIFIVASLRNTIVVLWLRKSDLGMLVLVTTSLHVFGSKFELLKIQTQLLIERTAIGGLGLFHVKGCFI